MTKISILTGINRPAEPSSGTPILIHDLYSAIPQFRTTFLGRAPIDPHWKAPFDRLITLTTPKRPHGPDFTGYVDELTDEVAALLQKIRPEAIHAQYLGYALSLAFTRQATGSIPVVTLAHGPDVIAAERTQWERELLIETVAASAAVVAPTSALAEHIDQLTRHRFTNRITVIPWGIPLGDIPARPDRPSRPGPLSVVHAGRLDENKSTITVVDALALAELPHQLTVIGDGACREQLEQRTVDLGLTGRVRFEPFLPRAELWRRLPDFDAFVATTRGLEAFGLASVEAQAHGLPVVYSNLPGMKDVLGSGGVPYPPGDSGSLAVVLDEIGRDLPGRQALSRAAVDNVQRHHIADTGRRLCELTRRVIG